MELAAVFNPTQAASGQFTASTLQTGSTMIVINKSYVDLIFTFASGDQRLVIANDRRAFVFADASSVPGPLISWKQENIDYPQTINQLQNLVYVEIYAPTEKITETYPANIQREALPSLIPYDIGYTSTGLFSIGTSTTFPTIWPSSYYGVTVAPSAIQGMAFDHFWSDTYVANNVTLFDVPGSFPSTGKTANNGVLSNASLASNIPGPFSRPGLTPVDSATYLNGTYWQLTNLITWPTTFYIDAWFNLTSVGGRQYYIVADNVVSIGINASGTVFGMVQYSGGTIFATSSTVVSANQWYHVALYVKGTTIQLWVNGVQSASTSGTGTIAATSTHVKIGADNSATILMVGSIVNIGVLLSDITTGQWGVNSITARYELGLQSLNVNMQKVWITGIDFTAFANVTTTAYSTVLLDNIYNPSGLLYVDNSANTDPLHIINPFGNTLQWRFPTITANTVNVQNFKPTNPITHLPLGFPEFITSGLATNAIVDIIVHGYNILGIK